MKTLDKLMFNFNFTKTPKKSSLNRIKRFSEDQGKINRMHKTFRFKEDRTVHEEHWTERRF